jgi:hypothetical protein
MEKVCNTAKDYSADVTAQSEIADNVVIVDTCTRRWTVFPYSALCRDSDEIHPVLRAICALNPNAAITGPFSMHTQQVLQRHGIRVADSVVHEIGRALREAL